MVRKDYYSISEAAKILNKNLETLRCCCGASYFFSAAKKPQICQFYTAPGD